ncbi:MAG: protein kinase [Planctomycetaceae bacterium]
MAAVDSKSTWDRFAFRNRDFVRGKIDSGQNRGKSFTVPEFIAERYKPTSYFASGGCGLLLKGKDIKTDAEVLIKSTLEYGEADYAKWRDEDGFVVQLKKTRQQLQTERRVMVWLKNRGCNSVPNPIDYVFDLNPRLAEPYSTSEGTDTWTFSDEVMLSSEPFLIMEFVHGRMLTDIIGNGIDERRSVGILREVCHVFEVLHKPMSLASRTFQLAYQDLKPDNVMVGAHDAVRLIDFGGCRVSVNGTISAHGAFTPGYCPPECDSTSEIKPSADAFSVGAMLYHMITGQNPGDLLKNSLASAVRKSVRFDDWDWNRLQQRASRQTVEMIKQCVAERPTERPADGQQLSQMLSKMEGASCI